jgi:hypothetical protein
MSIYQSACTAIGDYNTHWRRKTKKYKYAEDINLSIAYLNKTTGFYGTPTRDVVLYAIDNNKIDALKGFAATNYLRFIIPSKYSDENDNLRGGHLCFANDLLVRIIKTSFSDDRKMEMIKIFTESLRYKEIFFQSIQKSCIMIDSCDIILRSSFMETDIFFEYFINLGITLNVPSRNLKFGKPDVFIYKLIRESLYEYATEFDLCRSLRRYLKFGADPNITWHGQTPLQVALCHWTLTSDLAKILLCHEKTQLMKPVELIEKFNDWDKLASDYDTAKYKIIWSLSNEEKQDIIDLLTKVHFVKYLRKIITICDNYVTNDIFTFVLNLCIFG